MENRGSLLYDATVQGNLTAMQELLQQDRLALDRFIVNDFSETPLHVAAMLGHLDFVKEILQRKPQLAEELDSQGFSPLHLASAKGYVEVVKQLLIVCPDMCLARDRDGRNPLHLAATKGRIEVLRELVKEVPRAALATVGQSETVLHLCVIHNQLEALEFLVEVIENDEFLNAKNDYGYTILHLAVADKQIETVQYLLMTGKVEVNAVNGNGFTSLDILTQSHRDVKDFDIAEAIRAAGATRAGTANVLHIQHSRETNHRPATNNTGIAQRTPASYTKYEHILPLASSNRHFKKPEEWLLRKRDGLMVVASLIATMAFQSGVNPPGGLWQDDSPDPNGPQAGTSILAYKFANHYFRYLSSNTTGFIASLSIIMLLITGLPFHRKFFMWLLTATIVVAITSMALTYAEAIFIFTPKNRESIVKEVLKYSVFAFAGVMALVSLFNTIRLIAHLSNNLMPKRRIVQAVPSQSVYAN